jgi:hypothetical protein
MFGRKMCINNSSERNIFKSKEMRKCSILVGPFKRSPLILSPFSKICESGDDQQINERVM